MNRESPFSPAIFVVLLLIIEGTGTFLAYRNDQVVSRQLGKIAHDLQDLQNQGVTSADLDQLEEEKQIYIHEAAQWVDALRKLQLQVVIVTPQSFQDKLRDRVSSLIEKANHANVHLPPKFYFGFDEYRSALPPQTIATELEQELEVIYGLISKFIEFQILSISTIHRFSSREEPASFPQIPGPLKKIKKKIFDICFVSDQRAFRNVWNTIPEFPHLLSIEALQVIHSESQIPAKKEGDTNIGKDDAKQKLTVNSTDIALGNKEEIKLLFGKERLMITIRMAMLILTLPEKKNGIFP